MQKVAGKWAGKKCCQCSHEMACVICAMQVCCGVQLMQARAFSLATYNQCSQTQSRLCLTHQRSWSLNDHLTPQCTNQWHTLTWGNCLTTARHCTPARAPPAPATGAGCHTGDGGASRVACVHDRPHVCVVWW